MDNRVTISTTNSFIPNLPEGCPQEGSVILGKDNLLIVASNGNVYVKGRLVGNDEDIVDGLKQFLMSVKRF